MTRLATLEEAARLKHHTCFVNNTVEYPEGCKETPTAVFFVDFSISNPSCMYCVCTTHRSLVQEDHVVLEVEDQIMCEIGGPRCDA